MLFLVISTPRRTGMTRELIEARLAFRRWVKSLKKQVLHFYPRKGRGAVVILDLRSRTSLEKRLREWRSLVQAGLKVYPLEKPSIAEEDLRAALRRIRARSKAGADSEGQY